MAFPTFLHTSPTSRNLSLSIAASSFTYPTASLKSPHPPYMTTLPPYYSMHPFYPSPSAPPPIYHFMILRYHPLISHYPIDRPTILRNFAVYRYTESCPPPPSPRSRISSSATTSEILNPTLSPCPRDTESPLPSTVPLSTEIQHLILRHRLRDPESHTYPSSRQHQSRNLGLPTRYSISPSCAHAGIPNKKLFCSSPPHTILVYTLQKHISPRFRASYESPNLGLFTRTRVLGSSVIWPCATAASAQISHGSTVPY